MGFDEVRIRRTHLLLRDEQLITQGQNSYETDNGQQYGWDLAVYQSINRYREAATLNEYLADRRTELNDLAHASSPGYVAEGTPITPIFPVRAPQVTQEHIVTANAAVFVVHGRDQEARVAGFDFLRALGLEPREWEDWVSLTNKGTPYTGEVLDAAFTEAHAVLVLMTPDDLASLQPEYLQENDEQWERTPTGQARANVLFEAGMAFGRHPERTIIVELERSRPFSDVGGRNVIRMDDSKRTRADLRARLLTIKCPIDETTDAWLTSIPFPRR